MSSLSPNTPVIVGIGFHQEREDDPARCREAYQSMVEAVRAAGDDSGSSALLRDIESISVPQGMWQYRNPGRLIAAKIGCAEARSIIADLGVLQFTLLSDLCRAIAAGEQEVGVVVGGEAQFRALRSMITGQRVVDTLQGDDTPEPDVHHTSQDPFCSELEAQRGLHLPVEFYSIIESSLRHAQGLSIDAHRDRVAELYHSFSRVAADNPHAWRREIIASEAIRDAGPKNPMLAFPYTKRHCTQWNVNQSIAILVCSAGKARDLGLDPSRWIFPVAAAESRHVVVLAQRRSLHHHPGSALCGERTLAMAGIDRSQLAAVELYSCFPAAIQSWARDLHVDDGRPLTITGSMALHGGPFNQFSLEGVGRMVEVLRGDRSAAPHFGLVSNLSGIFGKQACVILSNQPNPEGYGHEEVSAAAALRDVPVTIDASYAGAVRVAGYTVVYSGETPTHAIAICDTPSGQRTVGRCEDPTTIAAMTREEFCGRTMQLTLEGSLAKA